ncbi:MAG: nitrile hydratase subunit alpha [Dehalococcoidia bacterium]
MSIQQGHNDHPTDEDSAHPGTSQDTEMGYYARRAQAIEALLTEKGICTRSEIQRVIDESESRSPADGARVVARAWVDSEFKARLLANAKAAVAELGYEAAADLPDLVVAENTDKQHHLVVCTLCSCYPTWLLGRPPDWYKSLTYRSRAVVDPRGVMREFGLELDPGVEVRVLDSTADIRYLVLPRRPDGTEGLSEEELAKLVTRDSMVGVSNPHVPEPAPAD